MRAFRTILSCAAACIILTLGWLSADTSEGKKEPGLVPEKSKPGVRIGQDEAEHEAIHAKLASEAEKNLREIQRLMEKIQNDLSRKETGDSTQGEQKETVRKLQELIDTLKKGCGKGG